MHTTRKLVSCESERAVALRFDASPARGRDHTELFFQDLQRLLESEFKFPTVVKYKDPEGDKVSMKKQSDFEVWTSI